MLRLLIINVQEISKSQQKLRVNSILKIESRYIEKSAIPFIVQVPVAAWITYASPLVGHLAEISLSSTTTRILTGRLSEE
jgi:hypothetical protein